MLASCHPPNPIWFRNPLHPPATKTSLSCRLPSPPSTSSSPYRSCRVLRLANILRVHRPPSLTSPAFIALHSSPSSSFIALCSGHLLPTNWLWVANRNCSYTCLTLFQCLTPCTSHQIETPLQFREQSVFVNWIVGICVGFGLLCNGHCWLLCRFNI